MALRRLYLDHNAAAPLRPAVLEAMRPWLETHHGNASSIHAEGRVAREAIENAAVQVAMLIGGDPSGIVFTSGGTEANNLALLGSLPALPPGAILSTAVEHDSVLAPLKAIGQGGRRVTLLGVNDKGQLDFGALDMTLGSGVVMASVMSANNETGIRFPVAQIAQRCRDQQVRFHTDATQSAGKEPVTADAWGVDLLTLSAHKLGGPKGVGALWIRKGVAVHPIIHGGPQQRGRRGGTENVAAIVGFGAAAQLAKETMEGELARQRNLLLSLSQRLAERIGGIQFHSDLANGLPNTLNFTVDGIVGDALHVGLDLDGVAISAGAACDAGASEPSHVLLAMGLDSGRARSAVRVSIGPETTTEDLEEFAERLDRVVARVRG